MSKKGKSSNESQGSVLLHRDLSTNTQLGMLISVCNAMLPALTEPEREAENVPGKNLMPGEAKIAAENTFTRACERIDSILSEAKRWGIEYQLALEKMYAEQHEENLKFLKAQQAAEEQRRETAEVIVTPHFRYKPTLFQIEDGSWAAFLGDIEDTNRGILGVGASPGEALKSFDQAFAGQLSPAVVEWLKQREAKIEAGDMTVAPFPDTETNEDKKLDDGGH